MTTADKPQLLFRADGSARLGLGHIMRCLALAEMLGPDYNRRFALVAPPPEVVALLAAHQIAVVPLSTPAADELLAHLSPTDVVVLDGYGFDTDFQRSVRQRAKLLLYIDDLVQGLQVADVVINHAGGLSAQDYLTEPYTELLLGPAYALLRPSFFVPPTPVPAEGTVFVSLGGSDPANATVRVLEALQHCFERLDQSPRVQLAVGPLQQNRRAIDAWQPRFEHLQLLTNLSAPQMVAELTRCRLAITACSTVAYEVASIGRPLVALQTAANQARLALFFTREHLGAVLPVDVSTDQLADTIQTALLDDTYRQSVLQQQHRFFDGRSPKRFRALFNRLCS